MAKKKKVKATKRPKTYRKSNKPVKDHILAVKVTAAEKKVLMAKAKKFADGNLSKWIRHAAVSYAKAA